MAQIPDISNLTINPVEVTEVLAQMQYQQADYLKYHTLVSGINRKTQILLDASSGNAGWKATGCAALSSGGMSIELAEKYWDLITIEDTLEYCQSDLDSNFKMLLLSIGKVLRYSKM